MNKNATIVPLIIGIFALLVSLMTLLQIKKQTEIQRMPDFALQNNAIVLNITKADTSRFLLKQTIPNIKLFNIGLGSAKNFQLDVDTSYITFFSIEDMTNHLSIHAKITNRFGSNALFFDNVLTEIQLQVKKSFLLPIQVQLDTIDLDPLIDPYIKLSMLYYIKHSNQEKDIIEACQKLPPLKISYSYQDVFENHFSHIHYFKLIPTFIFYPNNYQYKIIDASILPLHDLTSLMYIGKDNKIKSIALGEK
jgi:hypothetical protein